VQLNQVYVIVDFRRHGRRVQHYRSNPVACAGGHGACGATDGDASAEYESTDRRSDFVAVLQDLRRYPQ
jgi:hypothetical protein